MKINVPAIDEDCPRRNLESTSKISSSNSSLSSLPSTDSITDTEQSPSKHNHIDTNAFQEKIDPTNDSDRDASMTPPLPMPEFSTSTSTGETSGRISPSENTSR